MTQKKKQLRGQPRISIVTPSYNQARFIEQTILSVIEQDYENKEYILIDGGSSDGTLEIVKNYTNYLTKWISEPDRGQASAINKGFSMSSGDILAWLNSDDFYEPGALTRVADFFLEHDDIDVLSGRCRLYVEDGNTVVVGPCKSRTYQDFLKIASNRDAGDIIIQPEAFFRREVFLKAGPIREDLYYCIDNALWMAAAREGFRFSNIDSVLANLRIHPDQKTADLQPGLLELADTAWENLQQDYDDLLAHDSLKITSEIVTMMRQVLKEYQRRYELISGSTSYKVGRGAVNLASRIKAPFSRK